MTLHPIDTPEQRVALAVSNRRAIAERSPWPDGVLQECEAFDARHPGWLVYWRPETRTPGFEHPAGYVAWRHGYLGGKGIFRQDIAALDAIFEVVS